MIPTPPSGQGPIDPRGAFVPPPAPGMAAGGPPMAAPPGPAPTYSTQPAPMPNWPVSYPPRRRGGPWRWIIIAILLVLLIGSLIGNVILGGQMMMSASGNQTVLTAGDSHQVVAVIPLTGVIDSDVEQRFGEMLDRAEQDTDVKAVVIRVDTPGGEVGASDEIYHRIEHFKQIRKLPVVISMGSLATSGGYYVSCAGDYLFAEETTDTGNIGVLMPGFNFSKLMEKYGITDQTTVSTGTPYKEVGSPFIAATSMGDEYLQHLVDGAFARFKDVVSAGRAGHLHQSIDTIANGKVYLSKEARSLGLIDDIGYLTDATQYAASTASLTSAQVVRYEPQTGFLRSLLTSSSAIPPLEMRSRAETTGGPAINVDASVLDRLLSPRIMYLWRP